MKRVLLLTKLEMKESNQEIVIRRIQSSKLRLLKAFDNNNLAWYHFTLANYDFYLLETVIRDGYIFHGRNQWRAGYIGYNSRRPKPVTNCACIQFEAPNAHSLSPISLIPSLITWPNSIYDPRVHGHLGKSFPWCYHCLIIMGHYYAYGSFSRVSLLYFLHYVLHRRRVKFHCYICH